MWKLRLKGVSRSACLLLPTRKWLGLHRASMGVWMSECHQSLLVPLFLEGLNLRVVQKKLSLVKGHGV